tara:strand:+ start:6806 stop:7339 length:534 start_codon:yes stop_codon:yes gene_type:complete
MKKANLTPDQASLIASITAQFTALNTSQAEPRAFKYFDTDSILSDRTAKLLAEERSKAFYEIHATTLTKIAKQQLEEVANDFLPNVMIRIETEGSLIDFTMYDRATNYAWTLFRGYTSRIGRTDKAQIKWTCDPESLWRTELDSLADMLATEHCQKKVANQLNRLAELRHNKVVLKK